MPQPRATRGRTGNGGSRATSSMRRSTVDRAPRGRSGNGDTRQELIQEAKRYGITGRYTMNKGELQDKLARARRSGRR